MLIYSALDMTPINSVKLSKRCDTHVRVPLLGQEGSADRGGGDLVFRGGIRGATSSLPTHGDIRLEVYDVSLRRAFSGLIRSQHT